MQLNLEKDFQGNDLKKLWDLLKGGVQMRCFSPDVGSLE